MTTIAPLRNTKFTWRSRRRRSLDPLEMLAMAHGLAGSATSWPGMDNPSERCWRTVAATDRFEAWVVAWPVGGTIELHDHGGCAGAVVVASGTLVEKSVRTDGGELGVTSTVFHTGDQAVFGPGCVHDFVNHGPGRALSVHIYSPALHAMTYFDWSDRHRLVAVRTDEYREGLLVG